MLKANTTTRKFYNKWLYKVTLRIPGVAVLRQYKLEQIPFLNFTGQKHSSHSTMGRASLHKHELIALSVFLARWDSELWAKRIEHNGIDIYTNDKEMYNDLSVNFEEFVSSRSEPNEWDLNILENTGSIVVKKLPHDKYAYKAFLLPHKIKDRQDKRDYVEWIGGQSDRILISNSVKEWFIKTDWNWDRRYVLIEDSQTLLMLKLRNPEAIGRVYDYVISDK
jgi:hypothetical protein